MARFVQISIWYIAFLTCTTRLDLKCHKLNFAFLKSLSTWTPEDKFSKHTPWLTFSCFQAQPYGPWWPFSLWCVLMCLWMTQCVLCGQILSLESLDLFIQVGEWTPHLRSASLFFFFSPPSSPALPRLIRVNFNLRPLRSAKRESEMRWKQ